MGFMTRQFDLYGYLSEIDDVWKFDLEIFDDRMELQKLVYLMQAMGCRLDYNYSMYLHGPYSTDLTKEAFGLKQLPDDVIEWVKVNKHVQDEDRARIQRFKQMIKGMDRPVDLEILATLHYLQTVAYIPNKDRSAVERELIRKKPHVSEISLGPYWERLKSYNLI